MSRASCCRRTPRCSDDCFPPSSLSVPSVRIRYPPSASLFDRFSPSPPDYDEQNDYGQNSGTDSNHLYRIHMLPLSLLDLYCALHLRNRLIAAITLGTPDK